MSQKLKDAKLKVGEAIVFDPTLTKKNAGLDELKADVHVAHTTTIWLPRDCPELAAQWVAAMSNQVKGHTRLGALMFPGKMASPLTAMVPTVTMANMTQVMQMWGPAQHAVAAANAKLLVDGVFTEEQADDTLCIAQIFVHPGAKDDKVILQTQFLAYYLAAVAAWTGKQDASVTKAGWLKDVHPFVGAPDTEVANLLKDVWTTTVPDLPWEKAAS